VTTIFQTLMRNYSPHFTKKIIKAVKQGCFNRISQVAPTCPHLVHPNLHLHHTSSASCWVAFMSTARHVLGRHLFAFKSAPSCVGIWTPTRFLGPTRVYISNSISSFCRPQGSQSWQSDRQTDRPCSYCCDAA